MTAVILQARINSYRFPKKILHTIGNISIIEHALRRLSAVHAHVHILATNMQSVAFLQKVATKYHFKIMYGADAHVLSRFCAAIKRFRLTTVIRATADNPFVSSAYANDALREYMRGDCDYFAFQHLPLGTAVEVVGAHALMTAHHHSRRASDYEHVTQFVYNAPQLFSIKRKRAYAKNYESYRVTIDEPRDYAQMKRLFAICHHARTLDVAEIIDNYRYLHE